MAVIEIVSFRCSLTSVAAADRELESCLCPVISKSSQTMVRIMHDKTLQVKEERVVLCFDVETRPVEPQIKLIAGPSWSISMGLVQHVMCSIR